MKAMKQEISNFEQELMIHRPEAYQKYMEDKKEQEELGYDHIVWKTPESMEEAEFLLNAITKSNHAIENNKEVREELEEDSAEINFLQQFEGIDVSQLGEIDG